jgi:hypothetical protein
VNRVFCFNILILTGRFLMVRSILAVVIGYIVMTALVMLTFTPAFFAPELVFEKDGIGVTMAFMVLSLAMGGVAAVIGGFVAALFAGRRARLSLLAFAAIVLVFGIGSAVYGLFQMSPTVSAEEVARMTPMEKATIGHEPAWYAFLLPCIGSVGVLAAGWLAGRRGRSAPLPPHITNRP